MSTIVKLSLSPAETEIIDNHAKTQGVTRAQALRSRAFSLKHYTPNDYEELVRKARNISNLPRSQVEWIVNTVFVELMGPCD